LIEIKDFYKDVWLILRSRWPFAITCRAFPENIPQKVKKDYLVGNGGC